MKHKILGQVYTPDWIVELILNKIGYHGKKILNKYIMEPSCGDGVFLQKIIKIYINEGKKANLSNKEIKECLETYIYGIEIDKEEFNKCIKNLNDITKQELGEHSLNWKIYNSDTLFEFKKYLNFFDYIIGNPPYIRIHNLEENVRSYIKDNFIFSKGTIDLYLIFFEIGFKMLNNNGKLGYITPNAFLKNSSYKTFRNFLQTEKKLTELIDFQSEKVFPNFSTYTAITIFNNKQNEKFNYYEFIDSKITKINEIFFNKLKKEKWILTGKEQENFLEKINFLNKKIGDYYNIQYGFATLRDKIFIGNETSIDEKYSYFNGFKIEKDILKDIVKGSNYSGKKEEFKKIIFPYKEENNKFIGLQEEELKEIFPLAYQYFLFHKEELLKRNIDKGRNWYEFGRNQGLSNISKEKIVISTLFKEKIIFHKLNSDVFVYSGIFITGENLEKIEKILQTEDFFNYAYLNGKNFSSGYKNISSNIIKDFKFK